AKTDVNEALRAIMFEHQEEVNHSAEMILTIAINAGIIALMTMIRIDGGRRITDMAGVIMNRISTTMNRALVPAMAINTKIGHPVNIQTENITEEAAPGIAIMIRKMNSHPIVLHVRTDPNTMDLVVIPVLAI